MMPSPLKECGGQPSAAMPEEQEEAAAADAGPLGGVAPDNKPEGQGVTIKFIKKSSPFAPAKQATKALPNRPNQLLWPTFSPAKRKSAGMSVAQMMRMGEIDASPHQMPSAAPMPSVAAAVAPDLGGGAPEAKAVPSWGGCTQQTEATLDQMFASAAEVAAAAVAKEQLFASAAVPAGEVGEKHGERLVQPDGSGLIICHHFVQGRCSYGDKCW